MENSKKSPDSNLSKGAQPTVQNKKDDTRVPTVTADNDNGKPGPPTTKNSSNKGQGPAGENL